MRSGASLDDYREAMEKVIDDADAMIRIFDALLMIARAEAGAGREGMRDFDASIVASDVGELYEPVAENLGVELRGEIDQALMVHGSRELIGQALANLVDNALKYGVGDADTPVALKLVTLSATRRGTVHRDRRRRSGAGHFRDRSDPDHRPVRAPGEFALAARLWPWSGPGGGGGAPAQW